MSVYPGWMSPEKVWEGVLPLFLVYRLGKLLDETFPPSPRETYKSYNF